MKRIYYIVSLIVALLVAIPLQAQENKSTTQQTKRRSPEVSRGERAKDKEKEDATMSDLTVRAQDLNERMTQQIGNARWMRIIYRQINLTEEQNAPLYYPTQPMNGQMNLFSTLFQLVSEGKVNAYEYLDGYEDFSNEHLVNLKDMLDRFHIFYEVQTKGKDTTFVVNDSDIPSADVKSYYVKEAWYFDQNNSIFDVKILAICPILTSDGDIGTTTMGMFWIPYEELRPYIRNSFIMTSNINNAITFTMDDYFRRRMFKGDIIKTQNLMNQPLQAYCPTPDSLKREQDRIEGQLVTFEKSLWLKPDSSQLANNTGKAKRVKSTATLRGVKASTAKETKLKVTKQPEAKKSESSSAVRSVRRRR